MAPTPTAALSVNVYRVTAPAYELAYLPQEQFVSEACPICRSGAASTLMARVTNGRESSLETSFCGACEHRYFSKRPSPEWYARYYAKEYDQGNAAPPGRGWEWARRIPLVARLKDAGRLALSGRRPYTPYAQLFAALFGVTEGDLGALVPRDDVAKVLDVGCGDGRLLEAFRRKGFDVYGAEASERRVSLCRGRGVNVVLCPTSSLAPLEPYAPFDLACLVQVLEHMLDPIESLTGVASLLRPGGYVYIDVPNMATGEVFVRMAHMTHHVHTFTPTSTMLLLQRCGFTPIRLHADTHVRIVARKGAAMGFTQAFRDTVRPEDHLEFLWPLRTASGTRAVYSFAGDLVELRSADGGQVLYTRQPAFGHVRPKAVSEVDLGLGSGEGPLDFPVEFRYPEARPPPIWVKKL